MGEGVDIYFCMRFFYVTQYYLQTIYTNEDFKENPLCTKTILDPLGTYRNGDDVCQL